MSDSRRYPHRAIATHQQAFSLFKGWPELERRRNSLETSFRVDLLPIAGLS
jgi:hypothetical protein